MRTQFEGEELVLNRGQNPGDILLFYRPKGSSRLISWLTHSPYYHVAISEDVYHVIEVRPRGVVRRDLRTNDGGQVFKVIPAPPGSGVRALAWARGEIGAKYDGVGILVIILDRIFTRFHINYKPHANKFTCAEFVVWAFEQAGVELFGNTNPSDTIPADFAKLIPEESSASKETAKNELLRAR